MSIILEALALGAAVGIVFVLAVGIPVVGFCVLDWILDR